MNNIVIIGAGAAGLMAAISAGRHHPADKVIVLEQNNVAGKKLLLTGGGRCNITSAIPMADFYSKIPGKSKFLYGAFSAFTNDDLIRLLQQHGLKVKREADKIYPARDSAQLVVNTLLSSIPENVRIAYGEKVSDICLLMDKESRQVSGVVTDRRQISADKIIVATGGLSYPGTGSDGKFFSVLQRIGVQTTPFFPSLVPIFLKNPMAKLQGISVREVLLKGKIGKKIVQTRGDLLFTAKGLSGPVALDMSAYLGSENPDKITLTVDFLPEMKEKDLWQRIFAPGKKKIENKIKDLLPHKLLEYLFAPYDGKDLFNLKKTEQEQIVRQIKAFPVPVKGFGSITESVVTKGGVDLKQINPSTMEHKQIRGLYFAGECLDLNALTGGYNLQIAFSTGYLAGENV